MCFFFFSSSSPFLPSPPAFQFIWLAQHQHNDVEIKQRSFVVALLHMHK